MSEYVAIVGSRHGADLEAVERYVGRLPAGSVVVSGGAAGVDSTAARYARQLGITVIELKPDYDAHGRAAPLIRNKDIANTGDCAELDTKGVGSASR